MAEPHRCPICRLLWVFDEKRTRCERCWRLGLYGVIVDLGIALPISHMRAMDSELDILDAVASLLIDGARQRQIARRNLDEAISERDY